MQIKHRFNVFYLLLVLVRKMFYKLKNIKMKKIEEKINEWWNKDLFVIDIGIYEISVDNGMICSLILIIIGLKSLM